jgi:acetoin utilization deacetylase AcuC-like enzyme
VISDSFHQALDAWHFLFTRRDASVWYSPRYRWPISGYQPATGMDPRRADLVAWYLIDRRIVSEAAFRIPDPASYADISRVHSPDYLETLTEAPTLARIFAASVDELVVDEVLRTVRLACGGTIAAARESLKTRHPAINLLGGFHHAGPTHGGGFCAMNDIAIALAVLRTEGFQGRACVIDLDAHQPDGTAECLRGDPRTWIGSISGSAWSELPGVDETVQPPGTGDAPYLETLGRLLRRMPRPSLAFVVAGGDVLAGDRLGRLQLTLDGARQRDLLVADALEGTPSVWLPAGGYSDDAWRVLAGSVIALARRTRRPIRQDYDPMRARFSFIATKLGDMDLSEAEDNADIAVALGLRRAGPRRLLDYYSPGGVEYALFRYGLLDQLSRLGYGAFRIAIDGVDLGDRLRVYGSAEGKEYLLIETVLERRRMWNEDVLYVHWLNLRHPLAKFDGRRPALPGQDVPGLGLAREVGQLLTRICKRLRLAGLVFRPATYHLAYEGRQNLRFHDPARQARFEALVRDLSGMSLADATAAVDQKRVLLNGKPYVWEADEMVHWLRPEDHSEPTPEVRPDEWHFTVADKAPEGEEVARS